MLTNPHPHPRHALRTAVERHVSSQQAMIQAARDIAAMGPAPEPDVIGAVTNAADTHANPAH
jgi:hypothetical protein